MGNEQPGGTSHHFIMDTPNNKCKERRSPRWVKPVPAGRSKPSWQIARDISMNILSKKSPILSSKQGMYKDFFKNHSWQLIFYFFFYVNKLKVFPFFS